jgi:Icc-related predicted phosphoesterase
LAEFVAAMANKPSATYHVLLPRQKLRWAAEYLLGLRAVSADENRPQKSDPRLPSIRVVCVADTHNLRPTLPPGDLLVHAGDLTEWGTFDEVQSELKWLSTQLHEHKIVIAGNHDLLFDEEFLAKHPERRNPQSRTRHDLDFGTVTYLQDESITLSFTAQKRELKVYGSPWTPRYGTSAFQYPRDKDVWSERVPLRTDVLITHGPPARFNNIRPSAGCAYLREEVARVQPALMVFGHIHHARGEQTVTFDAAQMLHDDIMDELRGWEAIFLMILAIIWSHVWRLIDRPIISTRMINAAVVDGMKKDVALDAFVIDICMPRNNRCIKLDLIF